jgi:hypothetical protein
MNRIDAVIIPATLATGSLSGQTCVPTYQGYENDECLTTCTFSGKAPGNCPLCKTITYSVSFPDGFVSGGNTLSGTGAYNEVFQGCDEDTGTVCDPSTISCWPVFYAATAGQYSFTQKETGASVAIVHGKCGSVHNLLALVRRRAPPPLSL